MQQNTARILRPPIFKNIFWGEAVISPHLQWKGDALCLYLTLYLGCWLYANVWSHMRSHILPKPAYRIFFRI